MPTLSSPIRSMLSVLAGSLLLALSARAQVAKPPAVNAEARAACEGAARKALAEPGAKSGEVTFGPAPTVQPRLASDDQLVLHGEGRRRDSGAARSFIYSCTVDARTSEAVGLVLRDAATATAQAAPPRMASEPDLSHLSPTTCESSAAEALKQRWPRVAQISFDRATRRFVQKSANRADLQGQGQALPAPGAPSTHFGFDCEIDPRDGRVLSTRLSG